MCIAQPGAPQQQQHLWLMTAVSEGSHTCDQYGWIEPTRSAHRSMQGVQLLSALSLVCCHSSSTLLHAAQARVKEPSSQQQLYMTPHALYEPQSHKPTKPRNRHEQQTHVKLAREALFLHACEGLSWPQLVAAGLHGLLQAAVQQPAANGAARHRLGQHVAVVHASNCKGSDKQWLFGYLVW
jgi:hypothetical protein